LISVAVHPINPRSPRLSTSYSLILDGTAFAMGALPEFAYRGIDF